MGKDNNNSSNTNHPHPTFYNSPSSRTTAPLTVPYCALPTRTTQKPTVPGAIKPSAQSSMFRYLSLSLLGQLGEFYSSVPPLVSR